MISITETTICNSVNNNVDQGETQIFRLPDEIILEIFSFLNAKELRVTTEVCRRFLHVGSDNRLWKPLFEVRFSESMPGIFSGTSDNMVLSSSTETTEELAARSVGVSDDTSLILSNHPISPDCEEGLIEDLPSPGESSVEEVLSYRERYVENNRLDIRRDTFNLEEEIKHLRDLNEGKGTSKEMINELILRYPRTDSFYIIKQDETLSIDNSILLQISNGCRELRHFYFEECSGNFDEISLSQLSTFFSNYLRLRTVTISGFSKLTGADFVSLFKNHRWLETISYSTSHIDNIFFEALTNWPYLKSLTLSSLSKLEATDTALERLVERQWDLLELTLLYHQFSDEALKKFFNSLSGLTYFKFHNCPKLNDEEFIAFIQRSPGLKHLELSNMENLTARSAEALALHCPSLSSLQFFGRSESFETALAKCKESKAFIEYFSYSIIPF